MNIYIKLGERERTLAAREQSIIYTYIPLYRKRIYISFSQYFRCRYFTLLCNCLNNRIHVYAVCGVDIFTYIYKVKIITNGIP